MAAKIIKFGQISENADGDLVFKDFHVDANGQYDEAEVAILALTIERLKQELETIKRAPTHRTMQGS
jgi:hypothetical protein